MNKWIPISLFVFFGIYLLTTAQAKVGENPETQFSASLSDQPVNLTEYLSH